MQNSRYIKSSRLCRLETFRSKVKTIQFYFIEVLTDELSFTVKKRYSDFEAFYKRSRKKAHLSSDFPSKTIFTAGWNEEVTNQRMLKLNSIFVINQNYSNRLIMKKQI